MVGAFLALLSVFGMAPTYTTAYKTVSGVDRNLTSLDVYADITAVSRPVVIFIHGGGWTQGDKAKVNELSVMPEYFLDHGFTFVAANYRLLPEATIADQCRDVAAAVRWVYDWIGWFGGNPYEIFLFGHSAGAHLVSLVSRDESYLFEQWMWNWNLSGVLAFDGPYDIPLAISMSELVGRQESLEDRFTSNRVTQMRYSPAHHDPYWREVPLFVSHTSNPVNTLQAEELHWLTRYNGGDSTLHEAVGQTHSEMVTEFGREGDELTEAAQEFLDYYRVWWR